MTHDDENFFEKARLLASPEYAFLSNKLIPSGQWVHPSSGSLITVIGVGHEVPPDGIGESGDLYQAEEDMSTLFHWNGDGTYCLTSSFGTEDGDRVFYQTSDQDADKWAISVDKFLSPDEDGRSRFIFVG